MDICDETLALYGLVLIIYDTADFVRLFLLAFFKIYDYNCDRFKRFFLFLLNTLFFI